ncbi:MAG: hypothetical protein ABIK21_04405 [bacterium]
MEGIIKLLKTDKYEDGSIGYTYIVIGKYCSESEEIITCKNNNCKKEIKKGDTYYTYYINSSDKKIESADAINTNDKFCSQECAEEVCIFDLLLMDFKVRLDEIEYNYDIKTLKKIYDMLPKSVYEAVSTS